MSTEKWPLGVFASIDAGMGVQLDVAHELGVPTIHLHTEIHHPKGRYHHLQSPETYHKRQPLDL